MNYLTKKPLKKKETIKSTKKPLKKKETIKATKKPLKKKETIKSKNIATKPLKKYLKNIKKIGGNVEINSLGKLRNLINEVGSSIS
jgi:hypothetical protein